jgi:hypothetical protein
MSHQWELVHQWLEADLENNLGLLPQEWELFQDQLSDKQVDILRMKQDQLQDSAIAKTLGCTVAQMNRQWSKMLEQAWDLRNRNASKTQIGAED